MAATEVETPVKMCITVLDKKVRNLEKRKGKLDSYRDKLASGEELNKDQLEAIAKYNEVLQTLEFSRDLHKQFLSIVADGEKIQRKQAKKEKVERQQAELLRLQELLHLQTLLDTLGDDSVRERLKTSSSELVVTDENLTQLDEFYQLIAPAREDTETSLTEHIGNAAEHIQLYLDRSDRTIAGSTYCALHELVDRLEAGNCLENATEAAAGGNSAAKQKDTAAGSELLETGLRAMSLQKSGSPDNVARSDPSETSSLHSSSGGGIALHQRESPVVSFLHSAAGSATVDVPHWPIQSDGRTAIGAVMQPATMPVGGGGGGLYDSSGFFGGSTPPPPSSQLLATSHQVESPLYSHQLARQQRPLQDIVSSMQGSFHFLQESQIELENQSLLAAGRTSNPSYPFNVASSMPAGNISQFPARHSESPGGTLNHAASPHHFPAAVSALYHQPTTAAFYGEQRRASPAFVFAADQHQGAYLVSEGGHQAASSSEEVCPVPIPLPNEVLHGQSLTMNAFNATELSNSAVNSKQFSMNPNANVFRSVYEPSSVTVPESVLAPQHRPAESNDLVTSALAGGTMSQAGNNFPDSDRDFASVGGYDTNGLRGPPNYSGRQDNGYSMGGGGPVFNTSRSVRGGSYSTQRGQSSKSGPRGGAGSVGGGSDGMAVASGQGGYSSRGGGRGFSGQSGRVQQHMAA